VDAVAREVKPLRLKMRVGRAGRIIGIPLMADEAADIMRSIDIGVIGIDEDETGKTIEVEVPTFRPDLEREIDLVEEVARLYGYDRIESTLPVTSSNIGYLSPEQRARRVIVQVMMGLGLHEAITMAFISPRWIDILDPARSFLAAECVKLRNPISEETSLMRPSLLPGLLEAVRFNNNRRVTDVSIFEMGRVFLPRTGEKLPDEPLRLGFTLAGRWTPKQWERDAEEVDFFTAKGVLERLLSAMHIGDWRLNRKELPFLNPSRSCTVILEEKEAGCLGVIHPRVAEEADLPPNLALMELDVAVLLSALSDVNPYIEIPRFPAIQVDLAIVVGEDVDSRAVEEVIWDAGGELLREVRLFDLYRGEQLAPGEKSLAYSLSFYALDRTLKDEEARSAHENIVGSLALGLGARLR
jgi:phenylalanyl-tRNA synthetase beta chain